MRVLIVGSEEQQSPAGHWDLVAVMPDCRPAPGINCRCLLLPEGAPLSENMRADWAVTYGLSSKSTLSASSLMGPGTVLSVQREIHLPLGGVIDRQDIVLPTAGGDSMLLLWQAGLELLTGTKPEELGMFLC